MIRPRMEAVEPGQLDWTKEGRTDSFRYVRVTWPDMVEAERLDGIVAATVSENSLSTLKASGTLEYVGSLDVGEDLVRIYSDSTLDGKATTVCHGTFFVTSPSSEWSGAIKTAKADMYSVLWLLQQNKISQVYTAKAGMNAVAVAAALASLHSRGANVIPTASSAKLNAPHTWDAGTSYIEIINWLLDFAGYESAGVDAYGNIYMIPYVEPSDKSPVVEFSDTRDTVSEPGFTQELDTFEIPNVVTLICSNANDEPIVAHAINDDPDSPYSRVSRNKSIVHVETVSDVPTKAALQAKAKSVLRSSMSLVETVEISHSYQPFRVGDALRMDYSLAGYEQKLVSTSREVQMVPGMRCKTSARRFVNLMDEE